MESITIPIPPGNYAEFKEAFLLVHPVPADGEGAPTMTDDLWVTEWGRRAYHDVYRLGRKQVRDRANPVVIDPDILG